jgi:DNA polymerase III delta subunit
LPRRFFEKKKNIPLPKLRNSLKAALKADMALKGALPESGLELEKFILFMCR